MSFSFGGFGSTPAAPGPTPSPGGFAFGSSQPTATTGFGTTTTPATGTAPNNGFGFGTFGTNQPATSTGANPPPATQTGFGFGFGSAPTTATQPPATTNTTNQPTTGFGFGLTPTNTNTQPTAGTQQPPQQQQQFQAQYANSIEARFMAIKDAYSPSSPDCRFQTVFYNKVEPNTIGQYVRPPIANARLWEAAVKNNPDPSTLVPSLAVGFEDLRKRISEQDKAAAAFNATLASMSASLESMVHGHEASTALALVQLQRVHAQQSHRLLQLVNRVECARSKDILPRLPQELEFEHKLHVLERKITQPQPLSHKIAELSAMVKLLEHKNDSTTGNSLTPTLHSSDGASVAAWLQSDEPSAKELFQFLQTQRIALEHVTAMVKGDQRDLQTIQQITTQANTSL